MSKSPFIVLPPPPQVKSPEKRKMGKTKIKMAEEKRKEAIANIVTVSEDKNVNIKLSDSDISIDKLKDIQQKAKEILHGKKENVIFEPNEGPQTEFLASSEKEVFYGGARGGGKSYALIVDPLRYCNKESHRALFIRRTMPELRDIIFHTHRIYPKAYPGAKFTEQDKVWRFPSGARIEFGYCEHPTDVLRYQGQAYSWIGIDELPQFPDRQILNDLRGSLRTVDPTLPTFLRATGNPGGVGSAWIKEDFIDPAPHGQAFEVKFKLPDGTQKTITRKYIPSKVWNNPYLLHNDDYVAMLASLPETKRRQWLEGDWDAWDGAAFPEFHRDTHVVKPFEIPRTWIRFRSADYGYSSPGCVLWMAVDFDGNIYVYRELYAKGLNGEEFAKLVMYAEREELIQYGVLDSSVWAKRGDVGPSIAETMIRLGCRWIPADRSPGSRKASKMQVHQRLAVNPRTNKPSMFIFENCSNLIRTLPMLPIDENDPEDVDTKSEDHAYDALRYGLASRPVKPNAIFDMFGSRISELQERNNRAPADSTFGY